MPGGTTNPTPAESGSSADVDIYVVSCYLLQRSVAWCPSRDDPQAAASAEQCGSDCTSSTKTIRCQAAASPAALAIPVEQRIIYKTSVLTFKIRNNRAPPLPKTGGAPSPTFGPFLLWPNGFMHQDATWYGGRPQPRGLCVRWGPSPQPQKGSRAPRLSSHVYCGQTAVWIKMALGMKVTRSPGDCVGWAPNPFPQKGGATLPQFSAHY